MQREGVDIYSLGIELMPYAMFCRVRAVTQSRLICCNNTRAYHICIYIVIISMQLAQNLKTLYSPLNDILSRYIAS